MNVGSLVDRVVQVRREHGLTLTKAKDLVAKKDTTYQGDVYIPPPVGDRY